MYPRTDDPWHVSTAKSAKAGLIKLCFIQISWVSLDSRDTMEYDVSMEAADFRRKKPKGVRRFTEATADQRPRLHPTR